jgi:hypothetical protein
MMDFERKKMKLKLLQFLRAVECTTGGDSKKLEKN